MRSRPETTAGAGNRLGPLRGAITCLLLAVIAVLAWPSPPRAQANVPCDVGAGPIGAVTGAVGLGNPAGDVCDKVSGAVEAATGGVTGAITAPVTGALKGLGNDVFEQLTKWVSEGASWLMGQVVKAIDASTTPRLDTEGFIAAYGRMAAIAGVMACAMLLLAVLEGIAQGSPGLLARVVLVNVPLAFLGTSLAFVVVQLLLGVTDGLSAAIADASHHDSTRFFEAAIGDLGHIGGQAGKELGSAGVKSPSEGLGTQAAGAVAVPLFVGFIAAIVGAFAAFFVWLELVMRDAAIYAVSLFMPLALAASIWPRWTGALRRTGELLVAVIGSKFVIVAIVSLAASLVTEEGGSVEHVLAAAALMCLACFAPFVLLRLIPFGEGAMAAAYGRRSAAGGAVSAVQIGSDVQILRNMGRSSEGSGVSLWSASEGGGEKGGAGGGGGAGGAPRARGGPGGPDPVGGGSAGSGGGASGAEGAASSGATAGAAGGPAAAAAAVPVAAQRGARGAAGRLSQTAAAQAHGGDDAGEAPGSPSKGGAGGESGAGSSPSPAGSSSPPRPLPEPSPRAGADAAGDSPQAPGGRPPRPTSSPPPTDRHAGGGKDGRS